MNKQQQIKPQHYTSSGIYEPIKIIQALGLGFSEGNILKYLLRAGKKTEDPTEDMKKIQTYAQFVIDEYKADYTVSDYPVGGIFQDNINEPKFKVGDKVRIPLEIKAEDYENSDIGWDNIMEESFGQEGNIVRHVDSLDKDAFWVQFNNDRSHCFYSDDLIPISCKTVDAIEDEALASNINILVDKCYNASKDAGWHDNKREIGTMLALIHSEISEAMEGDRKGLMDDHLKNRTMFEAELADAVIRICDLAGSKGIPLGEVILEKLKYNESREDHKRENRAKEGGKKY